VAVPEAPVYENDRAEAGEHDIGSAREVAPIQAIVVAGREESRSHGTLGAGIFSPHGRHHLRPNCLRYSVGHHGDFLSVTTYRIRWQYDRLRPECALPDSVRQADPKMSTVSDLVRENLGLPHPQTGFLSRVRTNRPLVPFARTERTL
jgi:hypothetical protein